MVKPKINVNTKTAYENIIPQQPKNKLTDLIKLPIKQWKDYIKNDFEEIIFTLYPEIKKIKEKMYESGAFYSSMSGSGTSVFGIYEEKVNVSKLFENYFCFVSYFSKI